MVGLILVKEDALVIDISLWPIGDLLRSAEVKPLARLGPQNQTAYCALAFCQRKGLKPAYLITTEESGTEGELAGYED